MGFESKISHVQSQHSANWPSEMLVQNIIFMHAGFVSRHQLSSITASDFPTS